MESQAGIQLMHSIKAVDPSGQATIALFDQRNLIVKPFCLGLCADKIPLNISRHRLFQSYLVERSAGDNHVRLSSGGCEIFRSIGRLMAVDTLLNNGDRLPLLWDNPGNAGNLYIIQTATDNRTKFLVINLDPQCRPIDPSKRFDEFNDYVRRVKLLLGADVSGEHARYRDRQFDTVLTLICQWVGGLDLSADQLIFARKEMIAGYRQVLVDDLQGDRDQLIERLRLCIDVVSEAITRGAVDSVTISGGHDAAATGGGNYEKQELADLRCAWRWLEAICRALPG
jgi:hypothetical protein